MNYTDKQLDYIAHMVKLGYSWKLITQTFNNKFNKKQTENAIRKKYIKLRNNKNVDASSDNSIMNDMVKDYKDKVEKKSIKRQNQVLISKHVTHEDFIKEVKKINEQTPIKIHKQINLGIKKSPERTVVAHISDTHIGLMLQGATMDGLNHFNPQIAARRFAFFAKTLAQYKLEHRKQTDLVLVLNGDILAGVIHSQDTMNILPISLQYTVALRIFTQFISYISQHFTKMTIVCETGNHDRVMHKENKGRQTDEKWDSFATILYESLIQVFYKHKNIHFILSKTPYSLLKIQGHQAMITHGDTVVKVGNPGKSINIKSITDQVNAFSSGLKINLKMLLVGHVHKSTYITLDNGCDLVINGTLSGTDEFAQSIGILSNNPIQQIFEVTKDHAVGDMRFVRVNEGDNDESLDQIIEPMKIDGLLY